MRGWCLAGAFLLLWTPALARQPSPGQAADIKLATWNLEWLTLRPDGDAALPDDAHPKRLADIATLAGYARRLNADAIGIQEVDGQAIAARIFPPDRYDVEMTHDRVVQRVGLAIRRDYQVTRHPDLVGLDTYGPRAKYPLRSGLDVTITRDGKSLRILVVHLKTGCWDRPLRGRGPRACHVLGQQLGVLEDWIAARDMEGVPFVVMGDFNRNMPVGDVFLAGLDHAAPMSLVTAGFASPCWGGEAFIDHILLGGAARSWLVPKSLRVMVYRQTAPAMKELLSDHCPVSVRLDPERPPPPS